MSAPQSSRGPRRASWFGVVALAVVLSAVVLATRDRGHEPQPGAQDPLPATSAAAVQAPHAVEAPSWSERTVVHEAEAAVPMESPTPSPTGEAVLVSQLPADLQGPLQKAFEACVHSCGMLGLPAPDWKTARITEADARDVIHQEAALKQRILDSALATERELTARLERDPNAALRGASGDRERLEKQKAERYPGWPDGYVYLEESDGREVRFLAVFVASDPVLAALERDANALTEQYAPVVRAAYRSRLRW